MAKITIDYQEYLELLDIKSEFDKGKNVIEFKHVSSGLFLRAIADEKAEILKNILTNVEETANRDRDNCERVVKLNKEVHRLEEENAILQYTLDNIPRWLKYLFG